MSSRRSLLAGVAGLIGVALGVAARGDASSGAPPDGTYTAVVDRIEAGPDGGDLAVLVCERDGETAGDVVVERSALPEGGRHVDAVLSVEVADGDLVAAADRPRETERRARSTRAELDEMACEAG